MSYPARAESLVNMIMKTVSSFFVNDFLNQTTISLEPRPLHWVFLNIPLDNFEFPRFIPILVATSSKYVTEHEKTNEISVSKRLSERG